MNYSLIQVNNILINEIIDSVSDDNKEEIVESIIYDELDLDRTYVY